MTSETKNDALTAPPYRVNDLFVTQIKRFGPQMCSGYVLSKDLDVIKTRCVP